MPASESPTWRNRDYYDILGVPPDASVADLARAYRQLARATHPDRHPADPAAAARFQQIAEAYEVLSDPQRRAAYDQTRLDHSSRTGRTGRPVRVVVVNTPAGGPASGPASGHRAPLWAGPVQHSPSARVARRGRDQQAAVTVGFAEAVYGTTAVVTLPEGGGAARDVEVRVPAGTADGTRLRLAGLGGAGEGGGRPGDLRVTVRVQPHARYGRQDSDLTLTVPVTFPEAVLGATVDIPGLSGEPLALPVPPGTRSGTVLRLTGQGVPTNNGTGDLLVTIFVDVPDQLSSESRLAIADLARRLPDPRAHWRTP